MTVGELKKILENIDNDRIVVQSIDEEGNSFRKTFAVELSAFNEEHEETGLEELTPELIEDGYTEEDVVGEDFVPCVVFWP